MNQPSRITEPPPVLAERLQKYLGENLPDVTVPRNETDVEAEHRRLVAHEHRQARWDARRPIMYADARVSDIPDATAAGWLDQYESRTLVLAGPVGVGKTHAAYAIGNQAVTNGQWCEAWTVTDLLAALRPDGGGAPGVRECDLLVLDDLMAQKPTDWAVETMTALVDARIREGRRQIVTTNAPYTVLEEAWGGRLMDRLAYRWTIVTLEGQSRRRAAW